MRISESWVGMAAAGSQLVRTEERESLQIMVGNPPEGDRVDISSMAETCLGSEDASMSMDPVEEFRHSLEALLVEVLSGRKVQLLDFSDLTREPEDRGGEVSSSEQDNHGQGWGMIYEHTSTYTETQEISFAGAGLVRTADGREIAFQLELNMSREFVEHHNLTIRAGDPALTDPLVLNFRGKAAELSDFRFAFDLNGDGMDDSMPGLAPGSAYLALDKNGNGFIDNGGELFGPSTGSGFQELAAHDQDQNGWIDEGDMVFDRLSLWEIDKGGPRLTPLKDRGIGAVFLGSVDAPFDLKDERNALQGRIGRHGLFLMEDGTAGLVQELDLRV